MVGKVNQLRNHFWKCKENKWIFWQQCKHTHKKKCIVKTDNI